MEGSDYVEMLKKLNGDKEQVLLKLKAIDMAIEAITQLSSDSFMKYSLSPVGGNDIGKEEKVQKRSFYDEYVIDIPNNYEDDMPLIEKFLFALNQKGGATAHDAADFVSEFDKTETNEQFRKRFTDIGSGLGRANKLDIKKVGKKYKYSLKKEIPSPTISFSLLNDSDKKNEI